MIEKKFDIPFISDLARREKQIQQNYRPIIAVHKWFARRPGTLFRGLILSEFSNKPLISAFYESNQLSGYRIADPFMGGGTPIIEANRLGCDVLGFDINPMSYWIVKQEIEHLNLDNYYREAELLRETLENTIGQLYRTQCKHCGSEDAHVKYFLWVKTLPCRKCNQLIDLFPGYLLSSDSRHPKNVFICPSCGELSEKADKRHPGSCENCSTVLTLEGPAKRNRCICPHCMAENHYPIPKNGPPEHRMFAIEYHCKSCKPSFTGRFFKKPGLRDLNRYDDAVEKFASLKCTNIPEDIIPSGDESNRLHRWGYSRYKELFNHRQLLGLELSAHFIKKLADERVKHALLTNFSDLLRYQNMLCRYDTRALKSLDIFSIHGFPVGLIQCESNFLGIKEPSRSICIGSGGWANIIEKYKKAKAYCNKPFEIKHNGRSKKIISIKDEWIGDNVNGNAGRTPRAVHLSCGNAATSSLKNHSLDAVFTDPPYFGNVQYAELMDFCYVWLRSLIGAKCPAFKTPSTRNPDELTGNLDMGRGIEHFTEGLSAVFQNMTEALKPGAPFAFTYHHNTIDAYYPVAVAILDSGLTCSGSIPCPAEMGASIHINGTGSSIIDTVFICRTTGLMQSKWLADTPEKLAAVIKEDIDLLTKGNVNPSPGDIRCIIYGHLIRLSIWDLRSNWEKSIPVSNKIDRIATWIKNFGGYKIVLKAVQNDTGNLPSEHLHYSINEPVELYGANSSEIPF